MLSPNSPGAASDASFASASTEVGSPGYGGLGDSPDDGGSGGLSSFLRKSEPDPFFHYDVVGDINSPGSPLRGKNVQWRVKGVVPLEDIMYPSLNCLPKDVLSPLGSPITYTQRHRKNAKPSKPHRDNRDNRDNSPEGMQQIGRGNKQRKKKGKNDAEEETEEYKPDEGVKWAAYLSPVRAAESPSVATAESASEKMRAEMESKGEQYLRTRLKRNMRHNQHVLEQKRQAEEAKKANLLLNMVDHRARRFQVVDEEEEEFKHKEEQEIAHLEGSDHLRVDEHTYTKQTPDDLFTEITQSINARQMAMQQSRPGSRPGSRGGDQKLILEGTYLRQKAELREFPGTEEQDELENGVLLYRVRGELNATEDDGYYAKYLDDEEAVDPMVLKQRERRTRLLASLSEKRAEYHSSGAHLKRALRQRNAMDYDIDYKKDHATFDPHALQRSHSEVDRKQLQVSPIHNAPSHSKRVAQDVLLIHQFEKRILPEIYIKAYDKITGPSIKKMVDEEEFLSNMTAKERKKAEKQRARESGSHATVDMGSYGVGDEQGLCLGESLSNFSSLERLILKENRLTATSIPTIFANICTSSVMFIDVSSNKLHGKVCSKAIAKYLKGQNVCKHLNLSKCELNCQDIITLCNGMSHRAEQSLEELILMQNRIEEKGALALAAYMSRRMTPEIDPLCFSKKTEGNSISSIKTLNIGWNNITAAGAIALAGAIRISTNLKNIDMSANSVSDMAAQQIAAAIRHSTSLEVVNLQQNQVSSPACFVFARILTGHPCMKVLDLSLNPVGEPGARSIFRTILAGLKCFVMMKTCTFAQDSSMFNHSNPAADSPYELDLSVPYNNTVAEVLLEMMAQDPEHCKVTDAGYQDNPKGMFKPLGLHAVNGMTCEKGHTKEWKVPTVGNLQLAFQYSMKIPTIAHAMTNHAIFVLQIIIVTARSEADRRNWLKLLLKDVFCTTLQAQGIIDHFVEKQVIGIGGLKKIDVMNAVWPRLLDPHHMVEFLLKNITDIVDRRNMMYGMSLDLFKFNWVNPTGRWRFNLEDDDQRTTMTKFIAINKMESNFSQKESGREDTSQMEDWSNFRNASYTGGIEKEEEEDSEVAAAEPQEKGDSERYAFKPFVIDKAFTDNLPYLGVLEFDYVSTRRPLQDVAKLEEEGIAFFEDGNDPNQGGFEDYTEEGAGDAFVEIPGAVPIAGTDTSTESNHKRPDSALQFTPRTKSAEEEGNGNADEFDRSSLGSASSSLESGSRPSNLGSRESTPHTANPHTPGQGISRGASRGLHKSRGGDSRLAGRKHPRAMIISDQEMREFLITCGLNVRERCNAPDAFFKLAYMQLAATKYYFEAKRVCVVLECFSRDAMIQARVTVCFFSRIWDLHNFDVVMRSLSSDAQREVVLRLGYLNIMNPLKPSMDYFIDMRYADSRKALVFCLSTGPSEGGDQLRTEPGSDLTITDMFGSINRVLKQCLDARVLFSYGEVGERTPNVSWNLRTAAMKSFLVGTLPHLQGMQRIIFLYNKLLKENMITIGPIEQQYEVMLKRKKEEADAIEAKKASMKKRRFMQGAVKMAVQSVKKVGGEEAAA